ncbi:hypothetical protein EYF80_008534 [Liparis tanakae]|uniref:Uncharacterized protein n=1 Tax=Liparis tanakae TaxID=230148 RepID=A0A4Z2IT88_9TELE|nr:hypothetical protein EYF80_008534 [Liparis tanakae]
MFPWRYSEESASFSDVTRYLRTARMLSPEKQEVGFEITPASDGQLLYRESEERRPAAAEVGRKDASDAEVGVRGDDATLKDLLADHRGKGVFGCMDVGLDQPRVLRPCWGTGARGVEDNFTYWTIYLKNIFFCPIEEEDNSMKKRSRLVGQRMEDFQHNCTAHCVITGTFQTKKPRGNTVRLNRLTVWSETPQSTQDKDIMQSIINQHSS